MGCLCRDEQIVDVNGRKASLKGVRETFHFVRLTQAGHVGAVPIGTLLVKALRDVGNDIPRGDEAEYGRILADMFEIYCAVEPVPGVGLKS